MHQPNIVFITTDQMRDDSFGQGGNEVIQTIAMDHLAKRGVRFTKAFSSHPVCIPARASIMTGKEGFSLGITEYEEGFEIPTKNTLPQLLRDEGYQTKVVGKMHVYPERCHYGFEHMQICEEGRKIGQATNEFRGYDDYEIWLAEQGYPGQAFTHGMANNAHSVTTWHLPDHLHPTEWIGRETCKAIKNRDWTRPLFLWSSFTAPHPPLVPLEKDLAMVDNDEISLPVTGDWVENSPLFHQFNMAMFEGDTKSEKEIRLAKRAYYALIMQIDRQINTIIGTLREEGMLENTWFIFTSDHGDNLGDHLLWGKRNFLRGSTQIPFIVTPPTKGNLNEVMGEEWIPGQTSDTVVGLQDILPTCLDIAGVEIPEDVDGRSVLSSVYHPEQMDTRYLLGEIGNPGMRSIMLTDGKWKYIWYEQDGKELLFNLNKDPDEETNLMEIEKDIMNELRQEMIHVLSERENDPAINHGKLTASGKEKELSLKQKHRLATDHNIRGVH